MEKNFKKLKTLVLVLIVVLISAIAFYGLYTCKNGVWNNVIPEFKKGMELSGMRELRFTLSDESSDKEVYLDENGNVCGEVKDESASSSATDVSLETDGQTTESDSTDATTAETAETTDVEKPEAVQAMEARLSKYTKETRTIKENEDEAKNIENYNLVKETIQKRLEKISSFEYNIRQDSITGEIVLEVPDDDNVSIEEGFLTIPGKFELIDYQNGLVLIDDSHVTLANVVGNLEDDNTYQIYLQVSFDEEGKNKLAEVSKEYQEITDSTGTATNYYVSALLDGEALTTTYFGEELKTGMINIPMGNALSTEEEYNTALKSVQNIADVINTDTLPLKYELSSDNYIVTSLTNEVKVIGLIVFSVAILAVSIVLIAKYKSAGLKCAIFAIGYIALLTLVIRYTNVYITINSLIAFICLVALNYVFNFKLLNNLKNEKNVRIALANTMKEFYLFVLPVCIVAFIFTFNSALIINSVGMMLFWGLVLLAAYNTVMFIL